MLKFMVGFLVSTLVMALMVGGYTVVNNVQEDWEKEERALKRKGAAHGLVTVQVVDYSLSNRNWTLKAINQNGSEVIFSRVFTKGNIKPVKGARGRIIYVNSDGDKKFVHEDILEE